MPLLKADETQEASRSIVVSFDSKWESKLLSEEISTIFRKRGPKQFVPEFIYIYIGAPRSALIGRAQVAGYDWKSIGDALREASNGGISSRELSAYATNYDVLAVFTLSRLQKAEKALVLADLQARFGFFPPQSFLILSKVGKELLDMNMGFVQQDKRTAT